MRITSGRFKGMRLPGLRSKTVRPTTERVREAVFSILGPRVEGARILELFAGRGAFGFEALSRGAAFVVFVDKDKRVAAAIAKTARMLKLTDSSSILAMDALRAMEKLAQGGERFSIIYFDPPYHSGWITKIMNAPDLTTLFAADGVMLVEKGIHTPDSPLPNLFRKKVARQYGDTLVEILELIRTPVAGDL